MLHPWFSAMLLTMEATEAFTLLALKMGWGLTGVLSGHPLYRHQKAYGNSAPRLLTDKEVTRIVLERTGGTWPASLSGVR